MLMLSLLLVADVDTVRDVCEPTGYYYWLFGPIGPDEGTGLTAGGVSGGITYRGYMYWDVSSLAGLNITGVSLRMVTNNSGSGAYINVNKIGSYVPSWDDCGDEPYAANVPTPSGADQEVVIPLSAQAAADLQAAANGSGVFGLGTSEGASASGMHYFYSHWAWAPDDAWLIVTYSGSLYIDIEEDAVMVKEPARARLYDASGRLVKDMGLIKPGVYRRLDQDLPRGVYILRVGNQIFRLVR